MISFGKYSKFIVALVGALVLFLQLIGTDNDTVSVLISLATALGVYASPNKGA